LKSTRVLVKELQQGFEELQEDFWNFINGQLRTCRDCGCLVLKDKAFVYRNPNNDESWTEYYCRGCGEERFELEEEERPIESS